MSVSQLSSSVETNNVVTLNQITSMSKIANFPNGTFPLLKVFVFFSFILYFFFVSAKAYYYSVRCFRVLLQQSENF